MSACKIEKEVVLYILIKKSTYIISYINLYIYIYICKSATIIVHLCMIIVDLHLIFHYFFSLLHLTFFFFFSLFGTSHSHLTLAVPLISTALSPQSCHCRSPHSLKLSPIIEALVDRRCTR